MTRTIWFNIPSAYKSCVGFLCTMHSLQSKSTSISITEWASNTMAIVPLNCCRLFFLALTSRQETVGAAGPASSRDVRAAGLPQSSAGWHGWLLIEIDIHLHIGLGDLLRGMVTWLGAALRRWIFSRAGCNHGWKTCSLVAADRQSNNNNNTGWQKLAAFRRGQKYPQKISSGVYLLFRDKCVFFLRVIENWPS